MMMRVYLRHANSFESLSGKVVCPGVGFYNVPIEVGAEWIEQSQAFEATQDNLIIAWEGDDTDPTMLDVDAGDCVTASHSPAPPVIYVEPDPEPVAIEITNEEIE